MMGFVEATRTCFSKFLMLSGRASRPEYWWFYLFAVLVTAAASVLDGLIFGFAVEDQPGKHPFTLIIWFVTFVPLMAAGWRRMHDTGHKGWLILLPQMLVLIGFAVFLVSVGVFGLLGRAFDAPSQMMANAEGVIAVYVLVLFYAVVIAAALFKLWWLTRPGDEGANAYGPPPPH